MIPSHAHTQHISALILPMMCWIWFLPACQKQMSNFQKIFEPQLTSHCRAIVEEFISCACVLIHFVHVQVFATPWTVACQVPLPMGFSRQEYWSGLQFPSLSKIPYYYLNPTILSSLQGPFSSPHFLYLDSSTQPSQSMKHSSTRYHFSALGAPHHKHPLSGPTT